MTFIFTLDYEIFGDGSGSLERHVYQPSKAIFEEFKKRNLTFVNFVESAEFYKISTVDKGNAIKLVESQIKEFYDYGIEIGLHLHPQWFNAQKNESGWVLDESEYHCGKLSYEKLSRYFTISIDYLKRVLADNSYSPISFRAGNWLAQPSDIIARVMDENQMIVESSFFKGGKIKKHGIDYKNYPKNQQCWNFATDISVEDPNSQLLEIPIFTKMIPFCKALKIRSGEGYKEIDKRTQTKKMSLYQVLTKYRDHFSFKYPQKFDFTKMSYDHLVEMTEYCIKTQKRGIPYPVVLIGHSKNLPDKSTIGRFLDFLISKNIKVATFREFLHGEKC